MARQERLNQGEFLLWTGLGITSFFGVWYISVLLGVVPKQFLPAPHEVLQRFVYLLNEPFSGYTLLAHIASSFQRFLYGFLLAVVIGVPLGLLMALSKCANQLITPFFESIRFVAPIAWVPFAALWFGTGIGGPVLVIFMGAFPPVLINTYRGAIHVDKKYLEAARMLGAGRLRLMTEVLFPAAIPSIIAGLRISAGLGWQSLVGAELIVASSGVGYMMVKGQASIQTDIVMSGMIAIGLIGLLIDVLLRQAEKFAIHYREI
ncbi:ABC transporter permease [Polynucleobacter sp. MG-28-Ekke-A2]|uniref:ABC transporter permease n=1 Tax=Polynucleobacter sp. MG-28-Ekke-A2 TaxID=3108276 RepID=UPI002B22CAB5|nr:ABC transporter permease [Polynucleobacter sp. MG-28-Ekke-A2]MEA9601367.1 ABC transporter permease [Polynucleobacter sp. MG-28-Ekke-A2]